jgi:D-amino-acid dehydrogenase
MTHIAVLGAGITGVNTAYVLAKLGYQVTVLDRQRYPAMETSFANGGQLSASNAEVWNNGGTLLKGLKWMLRNDAPLLLNPKPSWHKYSWLAEFTGNLRHYKHNTTETTRLAIAAREHLFEIATAENIDFNLEKRGILHIYYDQPSFDAATKANALMVDGGLERHAVTAEEIRNIEPTLRGSYHAGFFTPSDSTGDIHKFTRGLAQACERLGVSFLTQAVIEQVSAEGKGVKIEWSVSGQTGAAPEQLHADGVVVCAGVGSRAIAGMLGDRINIYPVKGYSITVNLDDELSQSNAPYVSLLDERAKIVTSRLGKDRFRVAGTAEFNGANRDIRHDRITPLIEWTHRNFDINTARTIPWAGLRPMTPSMMPRVGPGKRPGVFYNTGHGHLGWTMSAATAELTGQAVAARLPLA